MDLRISIGEVRIRLDDADLTMRQVQHLVRYAASIALAIPTTPEPSAPDTQIGFTSAIERAPEYVEQDMSWYFEDSGEGSAGSRP